MWYPAPSVPPERRRPSRIPRLIATALRLSWDASHVRTLAALGVQAIGGIAIAVQLLITRDLISIVLTPQQSAAPLATQLVLLVAMNTAWQFAGLLQGQQQQVLGELITRRSAKDILDAAARVPLATFETPDFQDLLRRAQNAQGRIPGITQAVISLARSVLWIVGIAAALYALQPILLVVAAAGFVPLWYVQWRRSWAMYRFTREMTPNDRRRGYVFGLFMGRDYAKEIRAFGLIPYLRDLYDRLSAERLARLYEFLRGQGRLSFLGGLATATLTAVSYGALAYLVITGQIGLPEAGAAAAASQQLSGNLNGLAGSIAGIYESGLFLQDLDELYSLVAAIPPAAAAERTLGRDVREVSLEHVTFTYPGASRAAVRDVSLQLSTGQVVALVGENGSGKTTLAKLIAGLYVPDSGTIRWNGIDGHDLAADEIHDRVAVLFQDFARFMLSVRENIGFGDVSRIGEFEAILDASRRAGAHDFVSEWADAYNAVLGPVFVGGREISIGQWQRVALARAFFRDAPLIILDEPTAALDARAEHDLFNRIRELFERRSVLLISHRFSSVRGADRVYVLHEGAVVEHGTHAELLAQGGRYAELFTLQASAYFPEWSSSTVR